LDSLDGAKGVQLSGFQRLADLADQLKGEFVKTLPYSEEKCGADATDALKTANFDPSNASKMTGDEFKKIYNTLRNKVDVITGNHDKSGENRGGRERLENIFNNFIGPMGRSRDLISFFALLVWEGQNLKFTSRKLDEAQAKSSAESSVASNLTGSGHKQTGKEKRRREEEERRLEEGKDMEERDKRTMKNMLMMAAAFSAPRAEANDTSGAALNESRNQLVQAKIQESKAAAEVLRSKARMEALNSEGLMKLLSDEQKEKLKNATLEALLL
jgi:hypothetical protein